MSIRSNVIAFAGREPGAAEDAWDGNELRELRRARGLTLKALREKTGLSIGLLSQLERGITSPSIRSLQAISKALRVPAARFFKPTDPGPVGERGIIVRAGKHRLLTFSDGGFRKELVTPDMTGALEGLMVTIEPGGSSGPKPYHHVGEEMGFVLTGTLDLWVDDLHFRLDAGDSFRFRSERPHRFSNTSKFETRVLWVVTPPFY